MALQGAKLAGGNPKNDRVENDFYVKKLSQSYVINGEGYIKLINKK